MNPDTLVTVHCYAGDAQLVKRAMPYYKHHGCPVLVLSPVDSPVVLPNIECAHAGNRAYIGQMSLDRQRAHLEILANRPEKYFLMNDSDSFCVSKQIDTRLYENCESAVWSNEVTEPRPHVSPYPKIAMQPPYFITRDNIRRLLHVAPAIGIHPITQYIDWWFLALTCEAGLRHRPFTDLEHASKFPPFTGTEPWKTLEYRIRHMNTTMMHPIKTAWQVALCVKARRFYERTPHS